jgi:hypothetical protein
MKIGESVTKNIGESSTSAYGFMGGFLVFLAVILFALFVFLKLWIALLIPAFFFFLGILMISISKKIYKGIHQGTESEAELIKGDEEVLGAAFGVQKRLYTSEYEVTSNPENTIIVTPKRILFLYIPLPGAMLDTVKFVYDYILSKKIQQKFEEMTRTMTLDQILKSDSRNRSFLRTDFSKIKVGKRFLFIIPTTTVVFRKKDGFSFSYALYNIKGFKSLKKALK